MYHRLDHQQDISRHPCFYDCLCEDTLGHVIEFLGEEEKAEWCHVNERMRSLLVKHAPTFTLMACRRCGYYVKRCSCPRRGSRWSDCVVPIVVVGLFVIVVAAMGLAIMGYREGW
jgi:hypothetical protein